MRKKFKTKRSRLKILLFLIILYLIIEGYIYIYLYIKLPKTNEEFLEYIINKTDYKKVFVLKENNLFDKLFSLIMNIDLNEPKTLVSNYTYNDIIPVNIEIKPNIYIFNTHPLETYSNESLEATNITPDVIMASYLLQKNLSNYNINSIVEETNFNTYMIENNLDGTNPYILARPLIEKNIVKNNYDLIIDVHRDSINKKQSTIEIKGKKYAKILFVIGDKNENYKENLALANILNDLIPEDYKDISRGIYLKPNCLFNQDLNSNMIILEIGGYQNTFDEVYNSINIITSIIKEYLNEERG